MADFRETNVTSSMYLAPQASYVSSFQCEQQIIGLQSASTGTRRFYVKLNNGQEYGRVTIELIALTMTACRAWFITNYRCKSIRLPDFALAKMKNCRHVFNGVMAVTDFAAWTGVALQTLIIIPPQQTAQISRPNRHPTIRRLQQANVVERGDDIFYQCPLLLAVEMGSYVQERNVAGSGVEHLANGARPEF